MNSAPGILKCQTGLLLLNSFDLFCYTNSTHHSWNFRHKFCWDFNLGLLEALSWAALHGQPFLKVPGGSPHNTGQVSGFFGPLLWADPSPFIAAVAQESFSDCSNLSFRVRVILRWQMPQLKEM